jgi:hypothetical protein
MRSNARKLSSRERRALVRLPLTLVALLVDFNAAALAAGQDENTKIKAKAEAFLASVHDLCPPSELADSDLQQEWPRASVKRNTPCI